MKSLLASERVFNYINNSISKESGFARELRGETEKLPEAVMLSPPEVGQFLQFLVQLTQAKSIVEIGTFTGYTALRMAEGLGGQGQIICCDINGEWTNIGKKYWKQAGLSEKIDLRLAPAVDTLAILEAEIVAHKRSYVDFVFIDADKSNYDSYYESALRLLKPGGLIVLDNMLWSGQVAESTSQDEVTKILQKLNLKISQDPRVFHSLLSVGDGLMLVTKK